MAAAKKNTQRQTFEARWERDARERARRRLSEVQQAKQEATQRPQGYKSDSDRYGWALVIPVDSGDAGHVACYAMARMAQRLAGVCTATWPETLDRHTTCLGSDQGYYVECQFEVASHNQPPDEELRALVLGTLRDVGLEAMGITGAEWVRFQYDDWGVTAEDIAARNAEFEARSKAELAARVAAMQAEAELHRREDPWACTVIRAALEAGLRGAAPWAVSVAVRNGLVEIGVTGEPVTPKQIRSVVDTVPGLRVEWRNVRGNKTTKTARGKIVTYPSNDLWAHLKRRVVQGRLGGAADGSGTH
jgi:hypothetical protein